MIQEFFWYQKIQNPSSSLDYPELARKFLFLDFLFIYLYLFTGTTRLCHFKQQLRNKYKSDLNKLCIKLKPTLWRKPSLCFNSNIISRKVTIYMYNWYSVVPNHRRLISVLKFQIDPARFEANYKKSPGAFILA